MMEPTAQGRRLRPIGPLLRQAALLLLALAGAASHAAPCTVCTTVGSGAWNVGATWSGGEAPAASGTTVTINNGHTVTLNVAASVNTLTINSGGKLTGTLGSPQILTVVGAAGNDLTNNGTIDFQVQSGGSTQPLGYLKLGGASAWAGSGLWNLYSIDIVNRTLTFFAGTTATLALGAPAPIVRTTGTVTSLATVTWDFNALGAQTIPTATTSFNHGGITTSGSGVKTIAAGTVTALGNVTIGAGTTWNGGTNNPAVALRGHLTNHGTLTAGTGIYTFNGTAAQVLSGSAAGTSLARLTLNNATGLTIQHSVTVSTLLTLSSGALTTSGAGVEVIISASCVGSVTRTSGRVAGTLRKTIPTGSPTCAFEIGDASSYRPITAMVFAGVTSSFTLAASTSQAAGDHPDIESSALSSARSVNRWWTLSADNPANPFTSFSARFNFLAGDLDAGTATASLIVGRLASGAWSLPTVGTRAATYTQVTGVGGFGDFALAQSNVDHYELSVPSNSLACQDSTVTVTACTTSGTPCAGPATTLAGHTATLGTAGATLGNTTLTFDASGVATTTLRYPGASNGTAVTVTLSGESTPGLNARKCCPDGVACVTANSCSTTFNTAGFIVAATAGGAAATVPAQTAGTASGSYTLRAVRTSTTTQACESALSGATTVNWAYQCNNPTTCSAGNLMTITGNSATAIAGNPNTGVASYTAVPMTFDANGNAPFSVSYADVGLVTLHASKAAGGALLTALTGSSNAFVVKPAGFALSAIAQTAAPNLANPAAADAAGARFVKAGESFGLTVTAQTSGGATTPNFGRENTPEGVLLTPTLVQPAAGVAGTLANATVAGGSFSGGVATVSTLSYSEVGIVTLTPSVADGDYLGAGAVTGSSSANIGRFVPSHFALTAGSVTPACSAAFTYFGQDGFGTTHTLTARNSANATTQNYAGSFAKLGLGSWSGHGFAASGLAAGSVLAASATAPSGSWVAGEALVTATHQVSRPSALAAQTAVTITTAPVDSDGVALASATAVAAATPLRWGRLRLSNAFGKAGAALQLPVVAEYWNGNAWVLNSADSCTTLPAASVAISNRRSPTGGATATTTSAAAVALSAGSGLLTLAAPSPAGSGLSLDIAINLGSTGADQSCHASHPATTGAARPWLRAQNGACAATTDRDPAARASFGIFSPETRKTVHVREIF